MLGSAGNPPVRRFRLCFLTPDLQSGSRITSLGIGSGGGSCTHGGKAYEAHLNLILPAVKLVESVGNAPTSTCLQGRCIPCLPRPQREIGKSPWCCPRQAEFWRLGRTGWCATYWRIKRAGSVHAPGPCHFNKEQTPPGDLFDPSPRFHGGCFGVWGTPPPKPLNCKIRFDLPGCAAEPLKA